MKHTVLSASSACRPSSPPWSFCLGFLPWLLIVLFHGIAVAGPRAWTDVQGRTIEAEIIRATDQDVVVKLRDKEVTIPLAKLSEDDQNFVKDWLAENKDNDSSAEAGYRKIKAFASTGKDDNLVPQASAERIVEDLKGEGIRNTRSEFFEGGHTFYKPHF